MNYTINRLYKSIAKLKAWVSKVPLTKSEEKIREFYLEAQDPTNKIDDRKRKVGLALEGVVNEIYKTKNGESYRKMYNAERKKAHGEKTWQYKTDLFGKLQVLLSSGGIKPKFKKIFNLEFVRGERNYVSHFNVEPSVPEYMDQVLAFFDPFIKEYFNEKYERAHTDDFGLNHPNFWIILRRNRKVIRVILPIIAILVGFIVWKAGAYNTQPITQIITIHAFGDLFDIPEKNTGKIILRYGTATMNATIDENGIAHFPEIPSKYLNKEIFISIDFENYALADNQGPYYLTNQPINLEVIKVENSSNGVFSNDPATFKILILPFNRTCSVDNREIDIGDMMQLRFEDLRWNEKVPIESYYYSNFEEDRDSKSENYYYDIMKSLGADQIIFGRYKSGCDGQNINEVCYNYITQYEKHDLVLTDYKIEFTEYEVTTSDEIQEGALQEEIDALIYYHAMHAQFYAKNYTKTIDYTNRLIDSFDIHNDFVYYARGLSLLNLGMYEKSIVDFDNAFKFFNSNLANINLPYIFLLRGEAKRVTNKHKEAIVDYNNAMNRTDIDPYTYLLSMHSRAECYSFLGKDSLALNDYNTIVSIDPRFKQALEKRVELLFKMDLRVEAHLDNILHFKVFNTETPFLDLSHSLSFLLSKGHCSEVEEFLENHFEINSSNVEMLIEIAWSNFHENSLRQMYNSSNGTMISGSHTVIDADGNKKKFSETDPDFQNEIKKLTDNRFSSTSIFCNNSVFFFNKILEFDPTNADALKYFEQNKIKGGGKDASEVL